MFVLGLLSLALSASAADRPNILLLLTDDQRPDTISAEGNPHIRTPHLDGLVRRGLSFTRATCAHPLCYPSRAEILTGCTGWRNGTYSRLQLNAGVPLLPKLLQQGGYRTWYVGKWHTAGRPSSIGYEAVDGLYAGGRASDGSYVDFRGRAATGYRGWQFQGDDGQRFPERGVGLTPDISARFADAAIRFLRHKTDEPFFLHVNFTAPHDPLLWPPGLETAYDPQKLPLPVNFREDHPFDHGNARGRDEMLLDFPRTKEAVQENLACYYAVLEHLDAQIGRILAALDATGKRESTIIIFASDHGLALGSHGLMGKQNMYEHTINVPLVIAGPGVPVGERSHAQCYLRDLFPTICDLAGVQRPSTLQSRSLQPILRDPASELYPFIVGYFQDSQRMVRAGQWKLVWYPKIDRWQLFNVADDPHELRDRVGDAEQEERIADLKGKLVAWLKQHGDPLVAP